jgi:hypothetical protein
MRQRRPPPTALPFRRRRHRRTPARPGSPTRPASPSTPPPSSVRIHLRCPNLIRSPSQILFLVMISEWFYACMEDFSWIFLVYFQVWRPAKTRASASSSLTITRSARRKRFLFPTPNSSLASYVRPRVYAGQQVPNLKFKLVFRGLWFPELIF